MHRTLAVLLGLVAATGFGQTGPMVAAKRVPTFSDQVAEIIFENCTACHRPGEAAPFPLRSYADVKRRGRMIAKVTKRRIMPPWHPVDGHGAFVDEMRLTEEEIDILGAWVAAGMPEGDPKATPTPPEFPDGGWQLGKPDMILTMPKAYEVPAGGPDIYRNFVIPVDLPEDKWVTAIEVRPSARSVLHHVLYSTDTSGRARELDGRDGQPGWPDMDGGGGSRGGSASTSGLGGWAVGGQPRHLPMGLARKFPKGADIILRSHFHPSGKAESEKTTIALYFAKEPPERTMVGLQLPPQFGIAAGLNIPAGEKAFPLKDEFVLPVDCQAVTVGGHAHLLCQQMKVHITPPGGERQSIFWIKDWDFNWQNRYQYARPLDLVAGTKVEVELLYDNSANNPFNPHDPPKRVRWGLQSDEEMGSITLLLVAKEESDSRELRRSIRQDSRRKLRSGNGDSYGSYLISRLKMMDANSDGKISADEIPSRLRRFVLRYDEDDDGAIDAKELEAGIKAIEEGLGGGGNRRQRRDR